jgi:hypothetical protein
LAISKPIVVICIRRRQVCHQAGVGDNARHLIFGPEFPDASTRGLRNRIVQEWEGRDHPAPYMVVPDSELPVIGQARLYGPQFPMKRFFRRLRNSQAISKR